MLDSVIQCLTNGVFNYAKRSTGSAVHAGIQKMVMETMQKEKLSYNEAAKHFEINNPKRVAARERIYLEEGQAGLTMASLHCKSLRSRLIRLNENVFVAKMSGMMRTKKAVYNCQYGWPQSLGMGDIIGVFPSC